MRKHFLLILAVAAVAVSCKSTSGLSDESAAMRRDLAQARGQVDNLNQQLAEKDQRINQLLNEKNQVGRDLTAAQSKLQEVTEQLQETSDDYGVWFRVQIGAYEGRRIDKSLETTDQMSLEERDELQKIALGRFRNYDDAKRLQEHLKSVGLSDAWIVSYRDGERVPIEEVRN